MSERSEREIRESIETTRARMGDTIEQIGDRVNPDRVKADLKARARNRIHDARDNVKQKARNTMRDVEHGVSDAGRGIWATIKENPVPAGMVGVGLAWLIANRQDAGEHRGRQYGTYSTGPAVPYRPGSTASRYSESAGRATAGSYGSAGGYEADSYPETAAYGATGGFGGTGGLERSSAERTGAGTTGFAATGVGSQRGGDGLDNESEGIRDKASDALHEAGDRIGEVQERVGDAVQDTRERVGDAVQDTRERVGHMAHETQDRVSNWADEAKVRARRAEHRVEASMRENPVAAGAMALAFGVAAGLMIPESEREHELMGKTRDKALDRAQGAVRRSVDRMHDAASDAAAETARHAVDEVWPGGDDQQTESFSEPRR